MKLLIMNCDDFGQSPAMNQAIMHLLEEGKVSSATIMTPAPAFEEAAIWCRNHPEASIGLHLTLTSEFDGLRWSSLTGGSSLQDESGMMWRSVAEFEEHAVMAEVDREIEAQFDRAAQHGIKLSHVDNHMGSLYGIYSGKSYLPSALLRCSARKLPFRLFRSVDPNDLFLGSIPGIESKLANAVGYADSIGVPIIDYLLSHPFHVEQGETYETFKSSLIDKLYRLPDGIVETYIHPGVEDEWMKEHIPSWEKRVWEYRLMLDDDWAYALQDAGVKLIDYRQLHR